MKHIQHLIVGCFLTMICLPAFAQATISETDSPVGSLNQYAYSITDVGQAAIAALSVEVDTPVTDITSPTGWTGDAVPFGDSTTVAWQASDTPYEVQPNSVLSGFGFVSTPTIGEVQYSAFDDNFNNLDGVAQGPVPAAVAAVPEVSSIIILGFGLPILALVIFTARKRTMLYP